MILLAKYGRDKCHVCGLPATILGDYDTGGCWHGPTDTLTYIPLCEKDYWSRKRPPGCKVPACGAYYPAGTAAEKAAHVASAIEHVFGPETERQLQLIM